MDAWMIGTLILALLIPGMFIASVWMDEVDDRVQNQVVDLSEFRNIDQKKDARNQTNIKNLTVNVTLDSYEFFKMTKDYDVLKKIVYLEARGEPLEGKQEVVRVIFNRVKSDAFPNTISDVILQKGQFSPAHKLEETEIEEGYLKDIEWSILSVYYEYVLYENEPQDKTLYFVNPECAYKPNYEWMTSCLTHVKTVGNHEFYR